MSVDRWTLQDTVDRPYGPQDTVSWRYALHADGRMDRSAFTPAEAARLDTLWIITAALRRYTEYSGVSRRYTEYSGVSRRYTEYSGVSRRYTEYSGAPRRCMATEPAEAILGCSVPRDYVDAVHVFAAAGFHTEPEPAVTEAVAQTQGRLRAAWPQLNAAWRYLVTGGAEALERPQSG